MSDGAAIHGLRPIMRKAEMRDEHYPLHAGRIPSWTNRATLFFAFAVMAVGCRARCSGTSATCSDDGRRTVTLSSA